MNIADIKLVERLIDLKIQRLSLASYVASRDGMSGEAILKLMMPVETEIQEVLAALQQ
jgi:hypothetical protein